MKKRGFLHAYEARGGAEAGVPAAVQGRLCVQRPTGSGEAELAAWKPSERSLAVKERSLSHLNPHPVSAQGMTMMSISKPPSGNHYTIMMSITSINMPCCMQSHEA